MSCDLARGNHVGPVEDSTCRACNTTLGFGTRQPQAYGSALDQVIADAIENAKQKAIEEMSSRINALGGDYTIQQEVTAEAKRLLKEDPEVKERIRAALLRVLDAPMSRRH
jgi:hypothetical protein